MLTGGDTVVGAAAVEIYPVTDGFQARLKEQTDPAFGKLGKDAEKAGGDAGSKLEGGFKKGTAGIASTLAGLGLPLGNLGGHLSKAAAGIGEVDQKGKGLTGTLSTLGGGTLALATAGVVGFGVAGVMAAGKYESATTSIAANANISVGSAKKISDAFLNTAGKTIYSAQEIATAYSGVAGVLGDLNGKALTAAQAQKVMASAMNLAEGAGISLGAATEAVAKTMQAYHLGVTESGKASDILFNASRVTGLGVEQLGAGLAKVKSKLGDLAPSLGESAGLIDALAKNGVTGRASISALSGSFSTLVGGGKPATEMAKQLGVSIFDSSGRFVGMKSIIEQLHPKLADLTEQSQLAATKALFGASANRQLLGIIQQGPAAFAAHTAAVTRSGAAQEAAEKQSHTLSHQVDLLKATAVDLATKFGNVLVPKLRELAGTISEGITWLGKHKEAAKQLAILITTILGVAVGVFMVNKMKTFSDSFVKAGRTLGIFAAESTATAATVDEAGATIVAGADTTAAGVDTALGSTGVGLILVGLGLAAVELGIHWDEAMTGLEEAAQAAANVVIGALNEIIKGINETISALTFGLAPAIGAIGELSGAGGSKEPGYGAVAKREQPHQHEKAEASIFGGLFAGGLSNAAANGVLKVLGGESNLNPTSEGKEGAYGIAQWLGSRRKGLEQFAGSHHESGNSLTTQIQYLVQELKSGAGGVSIGQLNTAGSSGAAAKMFVELFERPAKQNVPSILQRGAAYGTGTLPEHVITTKGKKLAVPKNPLHEGNYGFFQASGTDYSKGEEPIIARDLGKLGESLKLHLTGVSGYRTPAHSIAVGGYPNDPHTRGEASDTPGIEGVSQKTLEKFGLTRPFAGAKEADHIQLSAKGLAEAAAAVRKGGTGLSTAGANFVIHADQMMKAEEKKRSADLKAGQSEQSKLVGAIHSGGVKELTAVVGGVHEKNFKTLVGRLSADHTAGLDKLVKTLDKDHKDALAALSKALLAQQVKSDAEQRSRENQLNTDSADKTAAMIADQTKLTLDQRGEVGKTGPDLAAQTAQVLLDKQKLIDDAETGAAKEAVDRAAGHGEAAESVAQQALTNAENQAKIAEANAQAQLDLANGSATEAQTRATEAQTKATEAQTKATEQSAGGGVNIESLVIPGKDMSTGELVSELGWALKTGALPVAVAG